MKVEKQHNFESKLSNAELKLRIDTVTKVNFAEVKIELEIFIADNFKTANRDIQRLATKTTPFALQKFYYDYILVATGNKVIRG